MRKQELIHLHGLLEEVEQYNQQEPDLSEYESLDIDASSIFRRKAEHREAVFVLIEAITDGLRDDRTAEPPANTV